MAGIATNWSSLGNYAVLGWQGVIYQVMASGVTAAFAGVPSGVAHVTTGTVGGFIAGTAMLFFPVLAFFVVWDFILDVMTGIETEAPHMIAFGFAVGTVMLMGYFKIGFANLMDAVPRAPVNDTILNATINNTTAPVGGVDLW